MVETNQAYIGSTNIKHIYAGSDHVKRVYKGSELVYLYGWEATFTPSSEIQTFTIPAGTHKVHIDCVASRGHNTTGSGGKGGRVQCDLDVTTGQTLYIVVGDIPSVFNVASYNASDIRTDNTGLLDTTSLSSRILVAGGGGNGCEGKSAGYNGSGGDGGGLEGARGTGSNNTAGYGGTQTAGGARGYNDNAGREGYAGSFGIGGNSSGAGAGGAGWYGGGGAGFMGTSGTYRGGGGGGGSSYTNENCQNVVHTQGYNDGAGYVTISYVEV